MTRPSGRDLLRNFKDYDAPVEQKVSKAVANNLRKLVTLKDCCGRPGEPGC